MNDEERIENTENIEEATEPVTGETAEITAEEKYAELNDKYIRLLAEYDNYRKRTLKEKEELAAFAKAQIVTPFLSVIDNLDRAIDAANEDSPLLDGVKLTKKQIEDILTALGVEAIPSLGEKFDPNLHNAVMHVDDESAGEGEIVAELQKGYKMGSRVLRFAMVSVAN